ncbi:unnamed protein product [Kuraishia capsulata CBS 1993]|uniref:Uncharacterized protein n=1 Tax=Kuraishia capsulata CBS 1993 TaxID=1382522 RepID=W6MQT0_9ASCO|nr:uncharacterized protein KUCA_T00003596001 [Kuraishia capsulata CBS 1993]CDK27617.1 unnamed protein product [Kuraishia capsulata CBS 1993]
MLQPRSVSSLLSQVLIPSPLTPGKRPLSISLLSSSGDPLCSCTSAASASERSFDLQAGSSNPTEYGSVQALDPSENLNAYSLVALNLWNRHLQEREAENTTDWLEVSVDRFNVILKAVGGVESPKWLLLMICEAEYPKGLALKKVENLGVLIDQQT